MICTATPGELVVQSYRLRLAERLSHQRTKQGLELLECLLGGIRMKQICRALFAGACIALAGVFPAAAQSHAEFYKSKNLRIMLGHPPGGSYDLYARLAAEFLPKYLPGNPTVIVEHKPGGGGVVATAWFYAQAPRDGSMISLFPETIAHTQILEPDVGKWKVQEMTYIGSFAPVNAAFVVRKGAP